MISRTAGEDCGKQDGDFVNWSNSSWSLQGKTKWTEEVSVKDLCIQIDNIQWLTTSRAKKPEHCRYLCENLNGRMTSVETPEDYESFRVRARYLNPILNFDGSNSISAWLPIRRESDGRWKDIYTNNTHTSEWNAGFPSPAASKGCAIGSLGKANWYCIHTGGGWRCSCSFLKPPFLTMRGLCADSRIDQTWMPYNSPLDGETTYYGNRKSFARFLKADNQWRMDTYVYNTVAMSNEISGRFMLGKQKWKVEGDNKKCSGEPFYMATLKLTGCDPEGEFTCDDGQCIKMERRCDQVTGKEPNCRDESDENGCQLVVFENNYNKNVPPIGQTAKGEAIPANVSISITLMMVVEIQERDHSIALQFEINLQWRENRATYQNLKDKTSLNALTNSDIEMLWLPLIIFDNTDQKQSTRLGWINEWVTGVSVVKEGDFTRSGLEEVDEAEIFKGDENNLTMVQTYTREFQCHYMLQRYPFDTQVKKTR